MVLVRTVRPAAERDSRSTSGTGMLRAARRIASSTPNAYRRSARVQNPAGESAVTDRTRFSRPSSRASRPPSELPATCGRSSSSASHKPPKTAVIVGRSCTKSSGSAGDAPNPGRSTAITSRSVARMSITGSQACRWCPMPCSSRSGSPAPTRAYARVTVLVAAAGPYGEGTSKATVADMGSSSAYTSAYLRICRDSLSAITTDG
ncbi:hypothetical protein QFZ49_005991 [Streptomyces turgidiscabies]|uniref:Uncharacterized protein n=1 Tax=Streptomyces turgidiscabies TaxID=85558 RepID=A0ABU0RVL7_9ACTN|nr:hypothetical protein [Streptomyces turgidiscabies]